MANLQRIETSLPGVMELRPKIFRDARGYFLETYSSKDFADLGIKDTFVQDNHSWSNQGVLRGLHYQLRHGQTKLCRVVQGEALDVAVDIRRGSPHFGKWTTVRLSAELQNQIYIPAGFAHGFLALTEPVQFLYKCTDFYHAGDEFGVLWNDPTLNIPWEVAHPNVSEKDLKLPPLLAIPADKLSPYPGT
jgi:dTDP-4-dehydrorhamnose 3,5-epimerase